MNLTSLDPTHVSAYLSEFVFIVYAQTRVDHPLISTVVPPTGTNVTFTPDGASAAPFNGGPNGGTISGGPGLIYPNPNAVPGTQAEVMNTIDNPKRNGDDIFISNLTLSGCTIQVQNGGIGVQRNVTLQVYGF
jgi:hypothetical protein